MSVNETFPVSMEDALAAIQRSAWTETQHGCEYCDHKCGPEPRRIIHSQGSICGADWDEEDALKLVRRSGRDGRLWAWSLFRHDLAIQDGDGRWMRFEVAAPDEIREIWNTRPVSQATETKT